LFFKKETVKLNSLKSFDIVYFSYKSGNTKRFVEKITNGAFRIPIFWDDESPFIFEREYVLFVPTYGSGHDEYVIPLPVKKFLNIPQNRGLLRGVVGMGNKNFGEHYGKAAEMIATKTGVPLIAKVEIFGTDDDVARVQERLGLLYDTKL
jgi:protein involved in ribonucleotide reduction